MPYVSSFRFKGITYDPTVMVGTQCASPANLTGITYNWVFEVHVGRDEFEPELTEVYAHYLYDNIQGGAAWHNPSLASGRTDNKCDGIGRWPLHIVRSTDYFSGDLVLTLYVAPFRMYAPPDDGMPLLPEDGVRYRVELVDGTTALGVFESDVIEPDPRKAITFAYRGMSFDPERLVGRNPEYPDDPGAVKGNWHFRLENVPVHQAMELPFVLQDATGDNVWVAAGQPNVIGRFPMRLVPSLAELRAAPPSEPVSFDVYVVASLLPGSTPASGLVEPPRQMKYSLALAEDAEVDERTITWQATLETPSAWTYNREKAAALAIQRARYNFDVFPATVENNQLVVPQGQPTVYGSVQGWYGEGRDYAGRISHLRGATGSSTFISEMIHDGGGLPMTTNPLDASACDEGIGPFTDRTYNGVTRPGKGWRYCPPVSPNPYGDSSANWRDHEGIIEYFGSFTTPNAAVQPVATIAPNEVNALVHFDNSPYLGAAGKLIDPETAEADFETLITGKPGLVTIAQGDYVFNDLGDDVSNHGFLVVGWGPVLDTLEAIDFEYPVLSPTFKGTSDSHIVPYVVDFCFGTGEIVNQTVVINDDNTGWLQDPRPRPFYSTAVLITTAQLDDWGYNPDKFRDLKYQHFVTSTGVRPDWQFYKMPDAITVPETRIYQEP